MIRVDSTMTMEAWNLKYDPRYLSWNHAWSASPAHIIPRRIIGIQPIDPGYGEFEIKPVIADLNWAKMKLPSIRGNINVSISQEKGKRCILNATVPSNSKGMVFLPKIAGNYVVEIDGKRLKNPTEKGKWIALSCLSGTHTFKFSKI
jgi:alpha-L-rhamnosidase